MFDNLKTIQMKGEFFEKKILVGLIVLTDLTIFNFHHIMDIWIFLMDFVIIQDIGNIFNDTL